MHQIQFDTHYLEYIIHLVNKFQYVITYECNVIHKEFIYSNQIGSFLTILDTISRLSSIYIRIAPNSIQYTLTRIYYPSCQQISVVITYECNVIHKEFIYSNQIGSFLTILDTISRLSSIYIHIAPNSIRYTLTTIYYPSCQQISVCYMNYECKVIHKEYIYSNQIGSFLTILDTISRLSSIYIHIAPNSIRYTLTTIYYPSC